MPMLLRHMFMRINSFTFCDFYFYHTYAKRRGNSFSGICLSVCLYVGLCL